MTYSTHSFFRRTMLLLPFLLLACGIQEPAASAETLTPAPVPALESITITGWFTIVWNGEPHYSITDDQGQSTRLLLDEEITKPLGGVLELDRKKITVVVESTKDSQGSQRVLAIRLAGNP